MMDTATLAPTLAHTLTVARDLYWQGHRLADIARKLDVPYHTLYSAKTRDGWDETTPLERVTATTDAQLCQLLALSDKSDADWADIDRLTQILERTARIAKFTTADGKPSDLNPKLARSGKKKSKNALTPDQIDALSRAFRSGLFGYQQRWLDQKTCRIRNILKSRQIGATWYFAREALDDALTHGDNQIFLSASRAQAEVFRQYIVAFVQEVTGVTLVGNPIVLANGASLYFLSTNSKTAQSYHGHVYLDEYAWIGKFAEFRKVASAMATHKKWRLTYFSTPSVIGHPAHDFWSGASFNKGRARDRQAEFDLSPDRLRLGHLGPDRQWRNVVTILDAAAQGCNLFDIESLRDEYNEDEFRNLFMVEWVDDTASFFGFDEMRRCGVDAWDVWSDFTPAAARPLGETPVRIGYDPALSSDNASIAVVAPPLPGASPTFDRYRVVEKLNFKGLDFASQAATIKTLCDRYAVTSITIDTSTIGRGVYEMVKAFYPTVRAVTYSIDVKTRMVLKAKHLVAKGMLAFDASWQDVILAFMAIRKSLSPSGHQATFVANRTKDTGHADIAWAIMHALDETDFTAFDPDLPPHSRGFLEFF